MKPGVEAVAVSKSAHVAPGPDECVLNGVLRAYPSRRICFAIAYRRWYAADARASMPRGRPAVRSTSSTSPAAPHCGAGTSRATKDGVPSAESFIGLDGVGGQAQMVRGLGQGVRPAGHSRALIRGPPGFVPEVAVTDLGQGSAGEGPRWRRAWARSRTSRPRDVAPRRSTSRRRSPVSNVWQETQVASAAARRADRRCLASELSESVAQRVRSIYRRKREAVAESGASTSLPRRNAPT